MKIRWPWISRKAFEKTIIELEHRIWTLEIIQKYGSVEAYHKEMIATATAQMLSPEPLFSFFSKPQSA